MQIYPLFLIYQNKFGIVNIFSLLCNQKSGDTMNKDNKNAVIGKIITTKINNYELV